MDWQAIFLSLRLSLLTALILTALSPALGYVLVFPRWRGRTLAEAVIALPLVLPPTVLGFYVLVAISPQNVLGRWYEMVTGHRLAFSFEGLLLASVLYSLPFAVQPVMASFEAVDRRLLEASWTLGSSPLRTFLRVIVPLSYPGIFMGFVLAFAHTMGEFGVVVMVGGNLPGITRTASVAIYDAVQALDYDLAGRTSLLLVGMSLGVLWVTYALRRRVWAVWPMR